MQDIRILGGLLKRIDNFGMDSIEKRIVFQKTVYFLQYMVVYLGYPFSSYLRGPYSKEAAKDGFNLISNIDKLPITIFLDKTLEVKFNNFLKFLGDKKNDSVWLEALSTLHLYHKLDPSSNKEGIINRVLKEKKWLDEKICRDAWNYLSTYGLI